ncbi:MAG: MFS transporter [Vicinamibacterales bacterium]
MSLSMDVSSELVHSLLPILMVTTLGASMATVGAIEGVAEATAAIVKVFSGVISDTIGRRTRLLVAGYGLSALTKPVFPLAGALGWVFAARFADRIGKGIRGAPRDALIADLTAPADRGAAYGLRQALDSVGALIGPALAIGLMAWLGDVRRAMWFAVVPAAITLAILATAVRDAPRPAAAPPARRPTFSGIARLPAGCWLVVLAGAVFTLARFSEAFLVLRATDIGLAPGQAPLVMVVMNLWYAGAAYPAGAAADRVAPRHLLVAGLVVLVAADLALAAARSPIAVLAGAAGWGLHMALTQGLFAKLVADAAQPPLVGTAFGVFNLVNGLALLLASVIAGALWSAYGAQATFLAGAVFAAAATAGLVAARHWRSRAA